MVLAFRIIGGKLNPERLLRALKSEFSDTEIKLGGVVGDTTDENCLVVYEEDARNLPCYTRSEYLSIEHDYERVCELIEDMGRKEQDLLSQFDLLRSKYDGLLTKMCNLLWSDCTPFHPELKQIPPMETSDKLVESSMQIGPYRIAEEIGEGQFATVSECYREGDATTYAVKVINKEKITSLTALRRISYEINALRKLGGNFVTGFQDAIQTESKLYIILDKGGPDLFDFFDKHPGGIPEAIAKRVSAQILNAILYCHRRFYCHRDIKPEVFLCEPLQAIYFI
jgi:serine/threonine protein kinase